MNLKLGFDAAPPQEALAFWRSKVPIARRAFDQLTQEYQVRAFTVSGLAKLDQLQAVQSSLEKALADGQDFRSWKEATRDLFERAGFTQNNAFQVETIFRNAMQTSYNAGRWSQGVGAGARYARYDAIDDERSRPTHRAQDNKVFPVDHQFWSQWWPPNGHNCRCSASFLTPEQVQDLGLRVEKDLPMARPSPGFDTNPGKAPAFKADLSKYSQSLRRKFLEGAARQPLELMRQYLNPEDLAELLAMRGAE